MPRPPRDEKSLLSDMLTYYSFLLTCPAGRTRADYDSNMEFRLAIERALSNVGEALYQLAGRHPATAARIPEYEFIIRFRHIVVHHYSELDHDLIWFVLENKIQPLKEVVSNLLIADTP